MNSPDSTTIELFRERRTVLLRVLTRRLGNVDEAEEVLQDAFIKFDCALRNEEISNPGGYLMKIALNLAVDRIRQDSSRRKREVNWFDSNSAGQMGTQYIAAMPQQDQALIAKQEMAQLVMCLDELSVNVRAAFILHKIKGLTHNETAAELGLSQSTVEKHIMKAMRHIMAQMADDRP